MKIMKCRDCKKLFMCSGIQCDVKFKVCICASCYPDLQLMDKELAERCARKPYKEVVVFT